NPSSSRAASHTASMSSHNSPKIGELWEEKRSRLREKSPYGRQKSWDIRCVLVKGGDDLRQELLASQLMQQFKYIFDEAKLPLWLRPYEVLVTGANSGIMEFVPDTCSVDMLKRRFNVDSVAKVFDIIFADNLYRARKCFIESHAAYSLISYLLQVKDRHNGNLLLDAEGHLIHIDFGYMLSNCPGNFNFETSPFKLTRHADRIILSVEMMLSATKMPCFVGGSQYTLDTLRDRFMTNIPEKEVIHWNFV
ncbi:phosphatidylinositol 3- and 4-kinase, partial [Cardiosporidium cionae]